MTALRLLPGSLFLPGDGMLHVLTRRGSFDLRGKDVSRLHDKLGPFLRGTHSEAELLGAVPPPLASAVRGYLDQLRGTGALGDAPPAEDLDDVVETLGAARPDAVFQAGTLRVHVSLDGPGKMGGGLGLWFVTPGEAAALLLRLRGRADAYHRVTCVVADAAPGPAELERRAGYARWLLRNELDVLPDEPRFQLFRLDGATGALQRAAAVELPDRSDLATLPEQLRVVRALEVDQVPLVAARAAHPFFPHEETACGLSFPAVRGHLVRTFLGRALLGADAVVAPSRAAMELALAERIAGERRRALRFRDVDLLAASSASPAVAYLRDVLKLRHPRLAGREAVGGDGLFVCEAGLHSARSFLPDRARAEVLLAVAWEEFYGTEPPRPAIDHREIAPAALLGRLAREHASTLIGHRVRRIRCWGMTLWTGTVAR
jgi:hypothetical protein